jgi:hypothetical protein
MSRRRRKGDESFGDRAEPMYRVEFLNDDWEQIRELTENNCYLAEVKSIVADWLQAHVVASRAGVPKDGPLATAIAVIVEVNYDA